MQQLYLIHFPVNIHKNYHASCILDMTLAYPTQQHYYNVSYDT